MNTSAGLAGTIRRKVMKGKGKPKMMKPGKGKAMPMHEMPEHMMHKGKKKGKK